MGTILWDMAAAVVLGLDFVLEPVEKISQTPEKKFDINDSFCIIINGESIDNINTFKRLDPQF